MKVREIMRKDIVLLKPEDHVIDFITLMENDLVHEAAVVNESGELIGFVHYKILADKNVQDPTKTKIETVMVHAPKVLEDEIIENAAKLIFETGFRGLPVVDKKGKVTGIVTSIDVLKGMKNEKIFSEKTAEDIMSPAIVIRETDDIGKARVIMRENNISTLPVVNENDELVGVVMVLDLLKAIKPKERISWYSMAAEKLTLMDIPVSTVMNKTPLISEKRTSLSEILEKMINNNIRSCIIVEEKGPVGVVTTRDLLEVYLSSIEKEKVYVQYSGLREEDDEVMLTVDRMVRDTVEKLHSIYPIQYFHIHVKRYKKSGDRKLFSVRCRVMTDEGVFISKAHAWDLRDAVGSALDKLEKIVIKHKEKLETSHRPKGS